MLIIYHSLTNNIERFLNKSNHTNKLKLIDGNEIIKEPFILMTYTIERGQIPNIIKKFMINNHKNCVGLIGSGNKNWGSLYCNATKLLKDEYDINILMNFELSGIQENIDKFNEIINEKI